MTTPLSSTRHTDSRLLGLQLRFERDAHSDKSRRVRQQMKYHHIGIPTKSPQAGETYLEQYDIHCTDHANNTYGIQWMRYGDKCRLPDIVKEMPHIAFEVDDLKEAIEGKEVIIEPNSPSQGVMVAFILERGAPVELLEFARNKK